MTSALTPKEVRPIAGDVRLVAQLRELHLATWPAGLSRFAPFSLSGDAENAYIAVAWDPMSRTLHVQHTHLNESPPVSRLPTPMSVDAEGWLASVSPIPGPLRPEYMNKPLSELPDSMFKGLNERSMLITAMIMVDMVGDGNPSDYILNDYIFSDADCRNERIKEIGLALQRGSGFKPYMVKLLTRFIWYGGDQRALLARTPARGGPDKERLTPGRKPGPLSSYEKLQRTRAAARGKSFSRRARRIDCDDIANIRNALTIDWADEKVSLATTVRRMIARDYKDCGPADTPTYRQVYYRYRKIVADEGLLAHRYGDRATAQYLDPRPGTASEITQGVLEILDIDGFRPKVPVGAIVNGELQPMEVWIIIAVSRLSRAFRGYAMCTEGERAEGYRLCCVSALLPLDDHIASLGLPPLPGIVHGNFDGVFVDNGAGKSKSVRGAVTQSLGGIMFNPPGARPDLNPIIERLNETMIQIISEETPQGYTRANNVLEKTKRRERRKLPPVEPDKLEKLFLCACNRLNLTADCPHLRTKEMRSAGYGTSPAEIHQYYQSLRVGNAARVRSPEEVYDIFLPWEPATCRRGRILYEQARYTSQRLKDVATDYSRIPGKKPPLPVWVKRVSRRSMTLICRTKDCAVFEIAMIAEDRRRFGEGASWLDLQFSRFDERVIGKIKAAGRTQSRSRLPVEQQKNIDDIEMARGNPFAGAIGKTLRDARRNSTAHRESELAKKQRAAYGLPPENPPGSGAQAGASETPEGFADDPLAAATRQVEEAFRKSAKQPNTPD
ncbi:hypothetical protein [Paraburkholderia sp. JHI869]|uniref:hypothetical protein n=1 Tax=Paraburkholderia sp. JHI869 TaxID=3112959 RepID=UPI00316EBA30